MKTHSIKFNFIMNAILTISSVIFPMITFPYYSRVLGASGTGSVGFALAVASYFTMVASLGVPTYGVRVCAQVRDDKKKLSQTVQELLIINGVTTAIMYVIYFLSLVIVPKFAEQRAILVVVSISILLKSMGIQWLYNALEKYSYITACALVFKILGVILMFAFVHKPSDYIIYGGISVIASYGSGFLNFINLRKHVYLHKSGPYNFRRHIKPIFTFFLMSASISIYTNLDKVMLGFMKTNTDVGYYDAAVNVKTALTNVVTSLGTVLLPRMSFYLENGENEAFKNTVTKAFRFVVVFASCLTVFFIIFARETILVLSGEAFLPAVLPMQLLMVTLILIGLSNITGIQILVPMGEENKVLKSIIAGALLDFILNWYLIPQYASTGAAFATMLAEAVVLAVQLVYLRKTLQGLLKQIQPIKVISALIIGSILAVLIKLNLQLPYLLILMIAFVVFCSIYGVILLLMKEPLTMEVFQIGLNFLKKKMKR